MEEDRAQFKDHFSSHASVYRVARPMYPEAVFGWMAKQCPHHRLAVDVGTGNGQAALSVVHHFERVVATDASAEQIEHAPAHEQVEYSVRPAHDIPVENSSAALVLAAQAAHWFDLERFFEEAERVLSPGGMLVLMSYGVHHVGGEFGDLINAVVESFYEDTLGPYWPPERVLVESGYASLTLPFEPITPPQFKIEVRWDLDQILAYLSSWSATQRFIRATNTDPIEDLRRNLTPQLPPAEVYTVTWPLNVRASQKSAAR